MKINPIVPPSGLMQTVSRTLTRPVMHSGPGGMLSDSDIAFIKAATHTEFNWPPGDGEGFPEAAFELAVVRMRQAAANSMIGQITAKDLIAMGRSGDLNPEFVSMALDYLDNLATAGQDSDTAERTDLRVRRPESTPTSGSSASDGSSYL